MSLLTTRKAIKVFQKNHPIPRNVLNQILADTMKAPSYFNLQPWRFFIIETEASKQKLKPCLYGNKTQLETSSVMILVFGNTKKKRNKRTNIATTF